MICLRSATLLAILISLRICWSNYGVSIQSDPTPAIVGRIQRCCISVSAYDANLAIWCVCQFIDCSVCCHGRWNSCCSAWDDSIWTRFHRGISWLLALQSKNYTNKTHMLFHDDTTWSPHICVQPCTDGRFSFEASHTNSAPLIEVIAFKHLRKLT